MANITTLSKGSTLHSTMYDGTKAYVVDNVIDYSKALTAKGSALAASDTIEALVAPAGTVILAAGLQQVAVADSTTLTLALGFTGGSPGSVNEYVSAFDAKASAAGTYSPSLDTSSPVFNVIGATADTIDLVFSTLTGTLTTGKVRVWALFADITGGNQSVGIAQVGS